MNQCSTNNLAMKTSFAVVFLCSLAGSTWAAAPFAVHPPSPVQLFPLSQVRLQSSVFTDAVAANRKYLLTHDPDRLLAPFFREAGLPPKKPPYPNWESMGLSGHTAGHYLSALAHMIASGNDPDGELDRRLDYMLGELGRVQQAGGNGYLGGLPDGQTFWTEIASGDVDKIWSKWAPWYNVHKTFAGLRDAYLEANKSKARELLVRLGDWCVEVTSDLSDAQMQQMLSNEYGGMNEVMADIYRITGDDKYLKTAQKFNHRSLIEPLKLEKDRLTGLHANTQIPKIIGVEEIAKLTGNSEEHRAAEFFWKTVTKNRSVAFGGNSVSEHFNNPEDFSGVIEHREGPETCNTYNMLRLTEKLFSAEPAAAYADYYERALYNHILSSINPEVPGFVYFTPLRPEHYRVYSQPEKCFWCCVGTGIENPGRYGQFIYAKDQDGGIYVNLFIPSTLQVAEGMALVQDGDFPFEPRTKLTVQLEKPKEFTLYVRHPWWVRDGQLSIHVNGERIETPITASSYAKVRRVWQDDDKVTVELPMHVTVEPLPDSSDWTAILYGPIVLASPGGTENTPGLIADSGRMAHVAHGPLVPLDKVTCLLSKPDELPKHVVPDAEAGPLHFRIDGVAEPFARDGVPLEPFFEFHGVRYQMYWELTTLEEIEQRRERLAAMERARAARDAATLDSVKPGEQQSEVEHDFQGEQTATGIHNGRRWRHGRVIQYTLQAQEDIPFDLSVVYSGDDAGREFDILANDKLIATQVLTRERRGGFVEKRYSIPATVLKPASGNRITIRFVGKKGLAGGLYDVRLLKSDGLPDSESVLDSHTGNSIGSSAQSHDE